MQSAIQKPTDQEARASYSRGFITPPLRGAAFCRWEARHTWLPTERSGALSSSQSDHAARQRLVNLAVFGRGIAGYCGLSRVKDPRSNIVDASNCLIGHGQGHHI